MATIDGAEWQQWMEQIGNNRLNTLATLFPPAWLRNGDNDLLNSNKNSQTLSPQLRHSQCTQPEERHRLGHPDLKDRDKITKQLPSKKVGALASWAHLGLTDSE